MVVWPCEVYLYRKLFLPRVVMRVAAQDRITVVFLAMSVAYWKYDTVYRRMAKDPRFNPIIMPVMRTNQPFEAQLRDHDEMMREFGSRGYNVVPGYDRQTKCFRSAKDLDPDVVFYTHPYSGQGRIRRMYDFWAQRSSLICYAPYYFPGGFTSSLFNLPLQNAAWRLFYTSKFMQDCCRTGMSNRGVNVVCSGYCFDEQLDECVVDSVVASWSKDHKGRKRIIWAPHHSIDSSDTGLRTSTFLLVFDLMKDVAIRFKENVFITFKPHPVLYSRLLKNWGRERTDAYYRFWAEGENTQIQQGDYVALFKGSDAMIHDCGSFTYEYLQLDKPCMFLYRPDFLRTSNALIKSAHDAHYSGRNRDDVVEFINAIVRAAPDPLKEKRNIFKRDYLASPNGKSFSENVVNEIWSGLGHAV